MTSGVPEGSVLGPLLFLIYIGTIPTFHFSEDTKLSLYADDILLYKIISSTEDYVHLQYDIDLSITIVRPHVNALEKCRSLDFEYIYTQDNGLNVIKSCLNFFIYHRWRIEGFSCHCLFFKIIHNLVYFATIHYPTPFSSFSSRYTHGHQFCIPFARINPLKHSFLPNSVSLWNNLPS